MPLPSCAATLGESLSSVQKYDVPLADATTTSLEALKAYSIGIRTGREKGTSEAIPFHMRAVELDPKFRSGLYLARQRRITT